MTLITFGQPIMAPRLEEFGLSGTLIAFYFAIPTIFFVVSAPMMYKIAKKLENRTTMMTGICIYVFAMWLLGPSYMLGFPDSLIICTFGLVISGTSCAFTIIP